MVEDKRKVAYRVAESLLESIERLDKNCKLGEDYLHPINEDTDNIHLKFMCKTIIRNIDKYSLEKLNRWIGYVQGVMVMRLMTTVEAEKIRHKECSNNVAS